MPGGLGFNNTDFSGHLLDITPSKPLPFRFRLKVIGQHGFITNPFFQPVEHVISIEAGQDLHDRAVLTEPAGAAADTEAAP